MTMCGVVVEFAVGGGGAGGKKDVCIPVNGVFMLPSVCYVIWQFLIIEPFLTDIYIYIIYIPFVFFPPPQHESSVATVEPRGCPTG